MKNGSRQMIEINSVPPNAIVKIQPTDKRVNTPAFVSLKRKEPQYILTISKDGFESVNMKLDRKRSGLWRDFAWIMPQVWIPGIIVDMSTGAAYQLSPDKINVILTPTNPSTNTPNAN